MNDLKPCPVRRRMPKVRYRAFGCCGTLVVKLGGKAGGYAVDGLDLVEGNDEN